MHIFKRFENAKSGSAVTVKVTPHARQTGLLGVMDDGTLKIQVAAPAEEGRANDMLVAYLASALGIAPSEIDIVAGQTSERKLISLVGITPREVEAKMRALAEAARAAKAAGKDSDHKPKAKPRAKAGRKK